MAQNKKLKAWITVEGAKLVEYIDRDDEESQKGLNERVVYVQASSGKRFAVSLAIYGGRKTLKDADFIAWDVSLDGKWMAAAPMTRQDLSTHRQCFHGSMEGVEFESGSQCFVRRFEFADLDFRELLDKDTPDHLKKNYQKLGEVRVDAWLCKGQKIPNMTLKEPCAISDQVSEKAVKGRAISMSARLGETQVRSHSVSDVWSRRHIKDSPEATFTFRYRSRRDLQDLMIIPRTPSPMPLEERSVDDLSPEELRELVQRQRVQIEATQPSVKTEQEIHIKRERDNEYFQVHKKRKLEDRASGYEAPGEDDNNSDDEVEILEVRKVNRDSTSNNGDHQVINLLD